MRNNINLELHESAAKSFNLKANELLLELKPLQMNTSSRSKINSEQHITDTIKEKDIIGEINSNYTVCGTRVAMGFTHQNKEIGFQGEAFEKLCKLADSIRKTSALKKFVSQKFIIKSIFDWAKGRYKGDTNSSMVEFVLARCVDAVQEFTYNIPIAHLIIQNEITIGVVKFTTLSKSTIDTWEASQATEDENPSSMKKWVEKIRKRFQGNAIASISFVAEQEYGEKLAYDEVEKALSLLRFYSPANFFPDIRCYCTTVGKENLRKRHYFRFNNNQVFPNEIEGIDEVDFSPWVLDNQNVELMRKTSLDTLSAILINQSPNEFQEKILTSLLFYSQASLCTDKANKLLYVLVSLESMLLKNGSEPIQQNIADRMAFALSKEPKKRMDIAKNVKDAYGLRSAFVHHGEDIDNLEIFKTFLHNSWLFYTQVFLNIDKFKTTAEFLDTIDHIKYS